MSAEDDKIAFELDEERFGPQEQLYTVSWICEIEAESPRHAAELAWEMQHDPSSLASSFEVVGQDGTESIVDLDNMTTEETP